MENVNKRVSYFAEAGDVISFATNDGEVQIRIGDDGTMLYLNENGSPEIGINFFATPTWADVDVFPPKGYETRFLAFQDGQREDFTPDVDPDKSKTLAIDLRKVGT